MCWDAAHQYGALKHGEDKPVGLYNSIPPVENTIVPPDLSLWHN